MEKIQPSQERERHAMRRHPSLSIPPDKYQSLERNVVLNIPNHTPSERVVIFTRSTQPAMEEKV